MHLVWIMWTKELWERLKCKLNNITADVHPYKAEENARIYSVRQRTQGG